MKRALRCVLNWTAILFAPLAALASTAIVVEQATGWWWLLLLPAFFLLWSGVWVTAEILVAKAIKKGVAE